jgi:hypothetical protein
MFRSPPPPFFFQMPVDWDSHRIEKYVLVSDIHLYGTYHDFLQCHIGGYRCEGLTENIGVPEVDQSVQQKKKENRSTRTPRCQKILRQPFTENNLSDLLDVA